MSSGRSLSIVATAAVALVVAGCSSSNSTAGAPGSSGGQAAAVQGFPVAETFDDAAWSIADLDRFVVRSNRIVGVTEARDEIKAYDADGKLAWSYKPEAMPEFTWRATDKVVGILGDDESGADSTRRLILLSIADGSVIQDVSGVKGDSFNVLSGFGLGGQALSLYQYFTDDGKLHELDEYANEPFGSARIVGDTLIWQSPTRNIGAYSLTWERDNDLYFSDYADLARGRILMSVGQTPQSEFSIVDAKTGTDIYTFTCDSQIVAGELLDGVGQHFDTTTGSSSPNADYSAFGPMRAGESSGACVPAGDQGEVTLTAVDDAGTAYGYAGDITGRKLVVFPVDGDPEYIEFPDPKGDTSPLAIMDGDIAVNWKDGVITGNPIVNP